jgi:ribosome maturation factor RimP
MAVELDRIESLVGDVARAAGCELVEVELRGAGRHRVLGIYIDSEKGITHGDCEQVSREVGTILDVEDLLPFSYVLEVSSPGLDRRLKRPDDFERFRGRSVRVRLRSALRGRRVVKGRLEGFREEAVHVTPDGEETVEIPVALVSDARLEVDWKQELQASRSR